MKSLLSLFIEATILKPKVEEIKALYAQWKAKDIKNILQNQKLVTY